MMALVTAAVENPKTQPGPIESERVATSSEVR